MRMRSFRLLAMLVVSGTMFGHSGQLLAPHDLLHAWSFDPGIIIPLSSTALLFARGARDIRGVSRTRAACFWSGWTFVYLSLTSPLHALGDVLFSAHMTQHELLMLVAGPLLVLSRPLVPMLWGLPIKWRKALGQWSKQSTVQHTWRATTRPLMAWWIHATALWIWHAPQLFEATLKSDWIHSLQHLSFLTSALLFWWSLFCAQRRVGYGANVLYVFTTAVHTSILGALLTFSHSVWYPIYSATTQPWGLSPLED